MALAFAYCSKLWFLTLHFTSNTGMITLSLTGSVFQRAVLSICLHSKLLLNSPQLGTLKRWLCFSGIRHEQVVLPPAASLWMFVGSKQFLDLIFEMFSSISGAKEEKTGYGLFCYKWSHYRHSLVGNCGHTEINGYAAFWNEGKWK